MRRPSFSMRITTYSRPGSSTTGRAIRSNRPTRWLHGHTRQRRRQSRRCRTRARGLGLVDHERRAALQRPRAHRGRGGDRLADPERLPRGPCRRVAERRARARRRRQLEGRRSRAHLLIPRAGGSRHRAAALDGPVHSGMAGGARARSGRRARRDCCRRWSTITATSRSPGSGPTCARRPAPNTNRSPVSRRPSRLRTGDGRPRRRTTRRRPVDDAARTLVAAPVVDSDRHRRASDQRLVESDHRPRHPA